MTDAVIMLAVVGVVVVMAMRVGYRWGHANGVLRGRSEGYGLASRMLGRKDRVS